VGANESGFGPSPRVIEAIRQAAPSAWMYGDPELFDLKQALGRHLGVQPDAITVGEGIDGLFAIVARLYLQPGSTVVTSLGAYPTFNYAVAGAGGRLVSVPYDGSDRESLDGLLDAVRREQARLVYLANPDNPMGTWWGAAEVLRFIEALPEETMLILDEAYGETAPAGTLPPLDISRPNVLRFRTFSKAYGLAGMRCGFAVGEPHTVRNFDRLRSHFGVGRLTQAAALAALADQDYLRAVVADIGASRDRIAEIAASAGLEAIPSATNFVAIDCGRDGAFAEQILDGLLARGIFVRKPRAPRLDRVIRISTAPLDRLELLAEALPEVASAARG
jgi:histidinol-phosphate aminotransferase